MSQPLTAPPLMPPPPTGDPPPYTLPAPMLENPKSKKKKKKSAKNKAFEDDNDVSAGADVSLLFLLPPIIVGHLHVVARTLERRTHQIHVPSGRT